MDVIARLDRERAETNVLEHPFYRRWSAGELERQELALYAGQYRRAVVALADASQAAAQDAERLGLGCAPGLRMHAAEERAHIQLWDDFAAACGSASPPAAPFAGTRSCVSAWTRGPGLLERLAVLYAIEAGQPEISRTKLEGLTRHYGYVPEGPAREYFTLHAERDVEHAAQARTLIRELLAADADREADRERMVAGGRAALRGNWLLLDAVQEAG